MFVKIVFNFLIVLLLPFGANAMDECKAQGYPPQACYQGRKIVFMPDKYFDERTRDGACSAGKTGVSVYCATGKSKMQDCYDYQIQICRFCKNGAEKAQSLNMDLSEYGEHCQSLENTPAGCKKIVFTPNRFASVKGQALAQLNLLLQKINDLRAYISQEHASGEKYSGAILQNTGPVSQAMFGPGGINERLDKFGSSDSIQRMRTVSTNQQTYWKKEALTAALGLGRGGDKQAVLDKISKVSQPFEAIRNEIRDKFIYKPGCSTEGRLVDEELSPKESFR